MIRRDGDQLKILIESCRSNSLQLVESANYDKSKFLGVLRGVAADFVNPTRNEHKYSEELWDKVLADSYFIEGLSTLTIIGELDHPPERLDTLVKEGAVTLLSATKDNENHVLICEFGILNTPNGRIVKDLLDSGVQLGVSSRGSGDEDDDGNVDPDSYIFVAFDVVGTPAVASARPTQVESVNNTSRVRLNESAIRSQISNSDSEKELSIIKSVVESTDNLPDRDSIIELIDNKLSSINANSSDNAIISKLVNDLEDAYSKIGKLEQDLNDYQSGLSTTSDTITNDTESNDSESDNSSVLITSEDSQDESSEDSEESTQPLFSDSALLTNLSESLKSQLKYASRQLIKYKKRIASLESLLHESNSSCTNLASKSVKLASSYRKVKSQLDSSEVKIESLSERLSSALDSLDESESTSRRLKSELAKLADSSSRELSELKESYESRIDSYKSKISQMNKSIQSYQSQITELTESLNSTKQSVKSSKLTESATRKEKDSYLAESKEATDKYLILKAKQSGLTESSIRNLLPVKYNTGDVDKVVQSLIDKKVRMSSIPYALNESVVSVVPNSVKSDPDMMATESFLAKVESFR